MKKNKIIFCIIVKLLFLKIFIFSQQLPVPKNYQLFTKYNSIQHSKFFKKEIKSSGYLIMDGKDTFLFKQELPVRVVIKKIGDRIIYKKGDNSSIDIDIPDDKKSIFMIFQNSNNIYKYYNVVSSKIDNKNKFKFTITPIKNVINGIDKITMIAVEDKIQQMTLFYKTGYLEYFFNSTITGTKPDKKYFNE